MSFLVTTRRSLSAAMQKADIGQIFKQEHVQALLKDITRFDEKKLFKRRQVPELKAPKLMFMTDEQLERAKRDAFKHVEAKTQMPPVMAASTKEPRVLSRDDDIVGYTQFKIMFIDISPGYSDRNRLMSVRLPDGTLREATYEERSRLNFTFYPGPFRSIDTPKLFEEKNLLRLMKRGEFEFTLDRACIQFEPDDPRYVQVTRFVYDYINDKKQYDKLRSTRHFGPMSLYLAYENKADDLLCEMLRKDLVEDAIKLVKIYNTCHNINFEDGDDGDQLAILRHYADNHSVKKYNLDLILQKLGNATDSSTP